jgi:hypothetical protein
MEHKLGSRTHISTPTARQRVGVRLTVLAPLLAAVLTLPGCGASAARWDREYACVGHEDALSQGGDAGAAALRRQTSDARFEFHLRGGRVQVKAYTLVLEPDAQDRLRFGARQERAWIQGLFDPHSGRLSLLDERTLKIDGRDQQVRTSGRYSCT